MQPTNINQFAYDIGEGGIDFDKVDSYLTIINGIIPHQIKSKKKQGVFYQMASTIAKRKANPDLSLAVLGQFSCGKSTFINGFLRQDLLKAKNEASTAAATFIHHSPILNIKVTFKHDYIIEARENDFDELLFHLERSHYNELGQRKDLNYFIELLTTNPVISLTVDRLEIGCPSYNDFLNGLVIIDTPGLFAGTANAVGHAEVTQSVIDNDADLAVVLLPAHQVISRTLIEFLQTLPGYLLERCVFIVSRMDMVKESEDQKELLDVTMNLLKDALNLKDPSLFDCSAISVLPNGQRAITDEGELAYWKAKFMQLEIKLKELMTRQRVNIIASKMKFLLITLLEEMMKEINAEDELLRSEELLLKKNSTQSIESLLEILQEKAKIEIKVKIDEIRKLAEDHKAIKDEIKNAADNKIDYSGSGIYGSYVTIENELHRKVEEGLGMVVRNVNIGMDTLNRLCAKLWTDFERQFTENYKTFRFIPTESNIKKVKVGELALPSCNFSSYKDELITKKNEKNSGSLRGAIWGGFLGFCVAGPFGIVPGAAMGGAAGNKLSEESLDTLQPRLKTLLKDEIEKNFKSSVRIIKNKIAETEEEANEKFKNLCDGHIDSYGKKIQALIDQHNKKKHEVSKRRDQAAAAQTLLSGILKEIK